MTTCSSIRATHLLQASSAALPLRQRLPRRGRRAIDLAPAFRGIDLLEIEQLASLCTSLRGSPHRHASQFCSRRRLDKDPSTAAAKRRSTEAACRIVSFPGARTAAPAPPHVVRSRSGVQDSPCRSSRRRSHRASFRPNAHTATFQWAQDACASHRPSPSSRTRALRSVERVLAELSARSTALCKLESPSSPEPPRSTEGKGADVLLFEDKCPATACRQNSATRGYEPLRRTLHLPGRHCRRGRRVQKYAIGHIDGDLREPHEKMDDRAERPRGVKPDVRQRGRCCAWGDRAYFRELISRRFTQCREEVSTCTVRGAKVKGPFSFAKRLAPLS